jgi:hypothetical protein
MTMYLQASRVISKKKLRIKNLVFVCILKAAEEKSMIWCKIRFRFNQWYASEDPVCLSRILIFTHPGFWIPDLGSWIPDPKTATKERG